MASSHNIALIFGRARRETADPAIARRSPTLALPHPARELQVFKWPGVGEGDGELGADFALLYLGACQEFRTRDRAHPRLS